MKRSGKKLLFAVIPVLLLVGVLIFSVLQTGSTPDFLTASDSDTAAVPEDTDPAGQAGVPASDTDPATQTAFKGDEILSYDTAREQNTDVVGWLEIPGTNLSTPVLQAHDNLYYQDKGVDRSYDYWGSVFAHFRNNMSSAGHLSVNTVLYGSNRNDGRMFGNLLRFTEEEYASDNRLIYLTVGEEVTTWVIISVLDCEANVSVFDYTDPSPDATKLATLLTQIRNRSYWDYDVPADVSDRFLTLTTDSYSYTYPSGAVRDNVRFAVVARLLREDETVDSLGAVTENTDRRQPSF